MALRDRVATWVEAIARITRPFVASHPRLRSAAGVVKRSLPRVRPEDPIGKMMFEFGQAYPEAFFVQVGAGDGHMLDPLRAEIAARKWRGIMVEPVPYVFERLQTLYGDDPRIVLENVAIAEHDGTKEFFYLAPAEPAARLPEWYHLLGSFRRDVLLGHRVSIPDIEDRLRTFDVPCLTFETLCRKNGVRAVDLVQMDVEGYDFEVLNLIDLDSLKPRLLMYEHHNFDDATRRAAGDHLQRHGYDLLPGPADTLALRTVDLGPRDQSLHRLWVRLQTEADRVRPTDDSDRAWVREIASQSWASGWVVSRGRMHDLASLPGFVAESAGERAGFVAYEITDGECEVVGLRSVVDGRGIGVTLLDAVRRVAQSSGCHRMWVVTTNDNTPVLRFYQHRGWDLVAVHRDAVEEGRRLKPEVPLLGVDSIPIRHELELELRL